MKRALALVLMIGAALLALGSSPAGAEDRGPWGPRRVLTFYYAWYGPPDRDGVWRHWDRVDPARQDIVSSTHYPTSGPYDSGDPETIARHLDQMVRAGIDGPVVSWWGQGEHDDQVLPQVLDAAVGRERVVSAYYETIPDGPDPEARAADDLAYLVQRYGRHRAWLKVGDRPVIFLYTRVLSQLEPLGRWVRVREEVRRRTGIDPFLVGDRTSFEAAGVFDGLHRYNTADVLTGQPPDEVRRRARALALAAEAIAHDRGRLACATVIPGYDDTKIRKPGLQVDRDGGETYAAAWDAVVGTGIDWVLLTSWNEWHEGTELEPSRENGDRELQATRAWSDRFQDPAARPAPVPIPPEWAAFAAHWPAGPIGLLGEPATVATEVLTSGLPWRMIDPARLCAGRVSALEVPILVYTGGETIHAHPAPGQSLAAGLLRHAREGGVLVWASPEPWPMFRDLDTGQTGWSRAVGLTVGSGFEGPPGPGLTVHFLGPLAPLGVRPFPDSGDPRFRPILPPEDGHARFDPLAVLRGPNGQPFGPALAILEYQRGPHAPSRMIYVWSRLWDIAGRDDLLWRVLGLASSLQRVAVGAPPPQRRTFFRRWPGG